MSGVNLVEGTIYQDRDPAVLTDTLEGFVPLVTSQHQHGLLSRDYTVADDGHKFSLILQTGTGHVSADGSCWGDIVIVKRLRRPEHAKKIYQQWKWSYCTEFKYDSPRMILFGMDTARADAKREFYQLRWENWRRSSDGSVSESSGRYQWRPYDVTVSGQTVGGQALNVWRDILDKDGNPIGFPHPVNENKNSLQDTEIVWDLEHHRLEGLRINGVGYGTLSGDPTRANELTGNVFYQGTLPTFESGCNPSFGIYNSNFNATTHSWAHLARQVTKVVA